MYKEFAINELFEKLSLKCRLKTFNKRTDVSQVKTSEFNLPLVNAKHGDNGIMYYGREKDWDSASMTLGVISNGAIATGDVNPHPQKTGVLFDAFLLRPRCDVDEQTLIYLSAALQKSIKLKFGYDNKATWSKVRKESVSLPACEDGTPDYKQMGALIRAIEKLSIQGVLEWRDKEIKVTKLVVENT